MPQSGVYQLYIPKKKQQLFDELKVLGDEFGLSVPRLIVLCVEACIDTLKKEIPKKRKFTLNEKEVIV